MPNFGHCSKCRKALAGRSKSGLCRGCYRRSDRQKEVNRKNFAFVQRMPLAAIKPQEAK